MSRDLTARIADARVHLDTRWSPERQQGVWQGVRRSQRKQRQRRLVGASIAALACLFVVIRWGVASVETHDPKEANAPSASAAQPRSPELLLRLEDGSTVTPSAGKTAEVKPVLLSPKIVELRLLDGSARFSVTPQKNRVFRVLAGDVTVTVLGTVFEVTLTRQNVTVAVERGRVRVSGAEVDRVLRRGERAVLPRTQPEPKEDAATAAADLEPLEPDEQRPSVRARVSWRDLARKGDYESAYLLLQKVKHTSVRNTPEDLLLAADVARLSGHPSNAVSPLRQLVSEHSGDPRAPLAAFTLGRVLLDQLGRPHEAAQAFATARRLAPAGSLAQDSLAREVESWSRAGNIDKARTGARKYFAAYPNSPRTNAVRRWAQLAD